MGHTLGGGQFEAAVLLRIVTARGQHAVDRHRNTSLELVKRHTAGRVEPRDFRTVADLRRTDAGDVALVIDIARDRRTLHERSARGSAREDPVGRSVEVAGTGCLFKTGGEEVVVLAIGVVETDGEVAHQLALSAHDDLVGGRHLHAVVDAARQCDGGRVDGVDAGEVADLL